MDILLWCFVDGVDYGAFNNSNVTIPAEETVVEFSVAIVDDNYLESSETFSGMLSKVLGDSEVIINNDTDTVTVTILDEYDSKSFV